MSRYITDQEQIRVSVLPKAASIAAYKELRGDAVVSVLSPDEADLFFKLEIIKLRLGEISQLQDGWLDGKGLSPDREALSKLANLFTSHFEADLPIPYLYPTFAGGIQAEWTIGNHSISLTIAIKELKGTLHDLDLSSGMVDEQSLNLDSVDGWITLNDCLRNCI